LQTENFAFVHDLPFNFNQLSNKWNNPSKITNVLIELDEDLNKHLWSIFPQLHNFNCTSLKFHLSDKFVRPLAFVNKLLSFLRDSRSSIVGVEFTLKDPSTYSIEKIKQIFQDHPRLKVMAFYASNIDEVIKPSESSNESLLIKSTMASFSAKRCGSISKETFTLNQPTYNESRSHNSCLNRKISIDSNGDIRNCPSMSESYGNIKDTTLEEAINKPGFKKYWNITKDDIEICKDCEFRYVCTDCRAYTERTKFEDDIDLSKPLKCGYNPYTNEWAEWSTNPLKEKAIKYYGMEHLVKKEE
jgi:SPASM domain peptide maturase of grasp-with-spasm system